jgi:predicted GTPase
MTSEDSDFDYDKTTDIESNLISSTSRVEGHAENATTFRSNVVNEAVNKLIISGLKEAFGNQEMRKFADLSTIQQMLFAIGASDAVNDVQSVERQGMYNQSGNPRDIVIVFSSKKSLELAYSCATNIKNFPDWPNVTFDVYSNEYDPEKKALQDKIKELERKMAALENLQHEHQEKKHQSAATDPDKPRESAKVPYQFKNANQATTSATHSQESLINNSTPPPPYSHLESEFKEFEKYKSGTTHMPSRPANENESSESDESVSDDNDSDEPVYENELLQAQVEKHVGTKKTLNILVLGETGVGKSTWINAIANYMTYDTLNDALIEQNPICLIPSKFTFYESATKKIDVVMEPTHGEKDENEVITGVGEAATQGPKTYQFETAKYVVRFIDTPGIGDVRGVNQDKENTQKILRALGNYKDLHAICFLFKANEARVTVSFRYCISQLLLQLNKDAINNIIFFFTNARIAGYSPGDTHESLEEFLSELKIKYCVDIELSENNTCCTDNEGFRLVCAHSKGVKFFENDFKKFEKSWKRSVSETHRFLEISARQRPNRVADMISINKARSIINCLAKPLADANEVIESNIKLFNDRKKELENTDENLADLKKKIKASHIVIEAQPLPYPKTVCGSINCTSGVVIPNTEQYQTSYDTICHDHCYLTGVKVEQRGDPALKNCAAMCGKPICQTCRCPWEMHLHIRFDQKKVTIQIEDEEIKKLIEKNESNAVLKKTMIRNCEKTIDEYRGEQKEILRTSLRFGAFIQANALLAQNDAFEIHVEHTIEEEEKLLEIGGDKTKLDNLKKSLAEYRQEKIMLEEGKGDISSGHRTITPDEIEVMKAQLFALKHCGGQLQQLFKETEDGLAMNNKHATVKYFAETRKPPQKPKVTPAKAKKPSRNANNKHSQRRR